MYIFIDESGGFIPLDKEKDKFSTVAAWVIPEKSRRRIFKKYLEFKSAFPSSTREVKGSSLSEEHFRKLFSIFTGEQTFLHISSINSGQQTKNTADFHKIMQAKTIRDSAKPCIHKSMKDSLSNLADELENLSTQSYIQACVMTHAISATLRKAVLYFPPRDSRTLQKFSWRIDAKDKNKTNYEKVWEKILLPILQTMSFQTPLIKCFEYDYTFFQRFDNPKNYCPEHLKKHLKKEEDIFYSSDLNKIFREDFQFLSSDNDLGLQIVDNLASAFNRAMNRTLKPNGWIGLGPLTIREKTQSISLIQLDQTGYEKLKNDYHAKVVLDIWKNSQSMFLSDEMQK